MCVYKHTHKCVYKHTRTHTLTHTHTHLNRWRPPRSAGNRQKTAIPQTHTHTHTHTAPPSRTPPSRHNTYSHRHKHSQTQTQTQTRTRTRTRNSVNRTLTCPRAHNRTQTPPCVVCVYNIYRKVQTVCVCTISIDKYIPPPAVYTRKIHGSYHLFRLRGIYKRSRQRLQLGRWSDRCSFG
jgi:hypothetical protein